MRFDSDVLYAKWLLFFVQMQRYLCEKKRLLDEQTDMCASIFENCIRYAFIIGTSFALLLGRFETSYAEIPKSLFNLFLQLIIPRKRRRDIVFGVVLPSVLPSREN